MISEVECEECGEIIVVDGEYPKFIVYCFNCHDYTNTKPSFDQIVESYQDGMYPADLEDR